jgi:hypothetical protein
MDYEYAMKKAVFLYENQDKGSGKNVYENNNFAEMALTKSGAAEDDISNILAGQVTQAAKGLSEYMFSANSELLNVLYEILGALKSIVDPKAGFFMFPYQTSSLNTFKEIATAHACEIQYKLALVWPRKIANIIESNLIDFFNFQEDNLKRYMNSRCKQFLGLINAVMEGQIHNLVIAGFLKFVKYFEIKVEEKDPKQNDNTRGLKEFIISPPDKGVKSINCFVTVMVTLKNSGTVLWDTKDTDETIEIDTSNEIVLFPPLDEIQTTLLQILALPVEKTTNCIPNIETLLLSALNAPTGKFIKSLDYSQHPLYEDSKVAIIKILKMVLPKISNILNYFKGFEHLIQKDRLKLLNNTAPLEEYVGPVRELNEARNSIAFETFDYLEFPPIAVDCRVLKQLLTDFIEKTLFSVSGLLASRIHNQCKDLLSRYQPLATKLKMDPGEVASWWKDLEKTVMNSSFEIENFNSQVLKR